MRRMKEKKSKMNIELIEQSAWFFYSCFYLKEKIKKKCVKRTGKIQIQTLNHVEVRWKWFLCTHIFLSVFVYNACAIRTKTENKKWLPKKKPKRRYHMHVSALRVRLPSSGRCSVSCPKNRQINQKYAPNKVKNEKVTKR